MAEVRTPSVLYDSGQRKRLGYLWSDFPLVWSLELATRARGTAVQPTIHFLSYPENNLLQGWGAPRCLHGTQAWGWVQVLEIGGLGSSGWWLVNCYDAEELVRWLHNANLPGRRYDFRQHATV